MGKGGKKKEKKEKKKEKKKGISLGILRVIALGPFWILGPSTWPMGRSQ